MSTRKATRTPGNKGVRYDPEPYTPSEVFALLSACEPRSKHAGRIQYDTAERNRALIAVLYRSGLRVQEALNLNAADVLLNERRLIVRHGKGDRRRRATMDDFGWHYLQPWMQLRKQYPRGPVFCTLQRTPGGACDQHDFRRALKTIAKRAGLDRRAEGFDLLQIKTALGHYSIDTTIKYLRALNIDTLLEPVSQRSGPNVPLLVLQGGTLKPPRITPAAPLRLAA